MTTNNIKFYAFKDKDAELIFRLLSKASVQGFEESAQMLSILSSFRSPMTPEQLESSVLQKIAPNNGGVVEQEIEKLPEDGKE